MEGMASDGYLNYPLLSYRYVIKAGPQWRINNKNQDSAWKTLEEALALDHDAALQACSWGMFQVMPMGDPEREPGFVCGLLDLGHPGRCPGVRAHRLGRHWVLVLDSDACIRGRPILGFGGLHVPRPNGFHRPRS